MHGKVSKRQNQSRANQGRTKQNMVLPTSLFITFLFLFLGTATLCWASSPAGSQNRLQRPPSPPPLAVACPGYPFPHVICIHRYGSVIAGAFSRYVLDPYADRYPAAVLPDDPYFHYVRHARFLAFDAARSRAIFGPAPTLDFMFQISNHTHEAPVYVPETNELYFSRLQHRYLPQLVVNLSATPPTLSERLADPPIYAAAGARYRNGNIIYATLGGDEALGGHSFRPGLYALNVTSGKSRVLLDNYYGYYFNSVDDLDIDAHGNIWFTDNGKSDSSLFFSFFFLFFLLGACNKVDVLDYIGHVCCPAC